MDFPLSMVKFDSRNRYCPLPPIHLIMGCPYIGFAMQLKLSIKCHLVHMISVSYLTFDYYLLGISIIS